MRKHLPSLASKIVVLPTFCVPSDNPLKVYFMPVSFITPLSVHQGANDHVIPIGPGIDNSCRLFK